MLRRHYSISAQCLAVTDDHESENEERRQDNMEDRWYSLTGHLQMKCLGGAWALLKPRRRYYFVLDELNCQLTYFKDESEFIRKRDPLASIELRHCAVTLSENNRRSFVIHAAGGRQYELEAANDQSALIWLNALKHRKDESEQRHLSAIQNAFDYTSLYSDSGMRSRKLSSVSLPSDNEMAAILDTAFQSTMEHNGNGSTPRTAPATIPPHADPDFASQCMFYFSGTPDGSGSLADDETQCASSIQEMQEPTLNVQPRRKESNAQSLQQWIRNWLSDQPGQEPVRVEEQSDDTDSGKSILSGSVETSSMNCANKNRNSMIQNSFEPAIDHLQEELGRLRIKDHEQRQEIQCLQLKIKEANSRSDAAEKFASSDPDWQTKYLHGQNKFLNAEVVRLSTKWQDEKGQYTQLEDRVAILEAELDQFKQQYVFLLQSCIRIPVSDRKSADIVEVKLFGGDAHKKRVCSLLEEARETDPTLPTFESLTSGNYHVDIYGFRHSFADESIALHYICTQLHQHYQSQLAAQQQHKQRWKLYLTRSKNILVNNKETRALVRNGIPPSYRSAAWRCLIHQQVVDYKLKFGKYYYRNLCSSQGVADVEYSSLHQKQITLDLLRTMPSNAHFSSPLSKGVNQLQQVLRAFCLHNPSIGYCQGMNFVAATCLLFLSPEDSFWFVVALTERYFVPSYFDTNLTGAQADQEVLKDLVAQKLPRLSEHLDKCDIDLATVTLNWFLPLFFEAVPFETMLRIWDCFLLEGPKVLFRFALGLLCLHEATVMERYDTISVMKILKAAAKHTYDTDGLIKLAFEGLRPFPRRQDLINKQACYLKMLRERLKQKEELKAALTAELSDIPQLSIEYIVFSGAQPLGIVAFGHQSAGGVALVDVSQSLMWAQGVEFDCRIVSLALSESLVAFASLISGYLVALTVENRACARLWELKLTDVALHLVWHEGRLYAALANGSLAVIENAAKQTPNCLELYYIPVGPAPLACAAVVSDQQLWCAMGNKAVILNTTTLDCMEHLYVAGSATGGSVSFFDKILCFEPSSHGLWLTAANSCLVQLWDSHSFTCRLLFDISADHNSRRHRSAESAECTEVQITSLLCHENELWVGTADGYLIMYDIARKGLPPVSASRYPAGQCLTAANSSGKSLCIPPKDDTSSTNSFMSNYTKKDSGYADSSEGSGHSRRSGSITSLRSTGASAAKVARRKAGLVRTKSAAAVSGRPILNHDRSRKMSGTPQQFSSPQSETPPAHVGFSGRRSLENDSPYSSKSSQPKTSLSMFDLNFNYPSPARPEPPGKKQSSGSLFKRLRSAASFSSLQSTDSYEFDDLMFLYSDDSRSRKGSLGGLCADTLARSASVWSLGQGLPWNVGDMPPHSKNSPTAERDERLNDLKLRRKDLQFDEVESVCGHFSPNDMLLSDRGRHGPASESASCLSIASSIDPPFTYSLTLQMKLKICDKPVKCLTVTRLEEQDIIVSCAGNYGDEEAVLRWKKEERTGLWINDPIVDKGYMRMQRKQRAANRMCQSAYGAL